MTLHLRTHVLDDNERSKKIFLFASLVMERESQLGAELVLHTFTYVPMYATLGW